MTKYQFAADTIKNSVSALDVGETLGLKIRYGRCQCPIHGGQGYNCVLYPGNRGYYCHVCKEGGDVIKFVREYHKSSFVDAVSWFNGTFNLGLDLDKQIDQEEQKRAENALKMRKETRELAEWKEQMQFKLYLLADRILQMLEIQRDENVPKTPDATWGSAVL